MVWYDMIYDMIYIFF